MQYPIVVANPYMQAAAHAALNPIPRAKYPLAASFFKSMFGTTNPQSSLLSCFGWSRFENSNGCSRRERLYHALELLLASEGREAPHSLPSWIVQQIYPSTRHRIAQRRDHRLSAKIHVEMKVKRRQEDERWNELCTEFLTLGLDDIYDWICDHPIEVDDFKARRLLEKYWKKHNKSQYTFDELYPASFNYTWYRIVSCVKNDIKL